MQNNIYQIQFKKQTPNFNIRKVPRRIKNFQDNIFTPQLQHQKIRDIGTYSSGKRQKQFRDRQQSLGLNFQQDTMVLNSKLYQDLKSNLIETRKRNFEQKSFIIEKIQKDKKDKQLTLQQKKRLLLEKTQHLHKLKLMKQRLMSLKENNQKYQQMAQNRMSYESQYLANLIMSMRFQAEYQHNIDPDHMTYQELLELEQKIGSVSRGITSAQRQMLQKLKIQVQKRQKSQVSQAQQCAVCYSAYQNGQFKSKISCGHEFHYDCLKQWFQKQKICPLCKQEVKFQQIQQQV